MPSRAKQIAVTDGSASQKIRHLLGPPPIISGEDPAAYEALSEKIRTAVEPKDVLEEIWVRDVADLVWDALRLRRLKAKLFGAKAHQGLAVLLEPLVPAFVRRELVDDWVKRDREAVTEVNTLLKKAGFDEEAIIAETFAVAAESFEKIERLIFQSEVRRNAILREIDRHRDALAQRLREATTKLITDTEFQEIEDEKTTEK